MRYQCSPHHINDAFFPISSQIWHAAGFVGGESGSDGWTSWRRVIALSGLEAREVAPFLASLLSIPVEGRYPLPEMSPSEQKERTIAALIALFEGLTRGRPVLALLEDAHWIDPTSLDVFGRLVDRLPEMRALVVITFRPEFTAPWPGPVTSVASAEPFRPPSGLAMIDRVDGRQAVAGRSHGADRRQDRRRAAVHGGADQDGAGVRPVASRSGAFAARFDADAAGDPLDLAGHR